MTVIELIWNEGFWFVLILILLFIPIVIRPILNMIGYNWWLTKLTIWKGWHRPWKSYVFIIPRIIRTRKYFKEGYWVKLDKECKNISDDDGHYSDLHLDYLGYIRTA